MKLNSTSIKMLKCITCNGDMPIKIFTNILHPDYGQPIVIHRKKLACSRDCLNEWQRTISWEDRVGKECADMIRENTAERMKAGNPSSDPAVAKKISEGLKKYIENNPGIRAGENNGFYSKSHTEERKNQWSQSKSGIRSYTDEQRIYQLINTPKKENHPNWNNGSSTGVYGKEFTRELKKIVKESYEYTCQLCNTKTEILDVHHIDYDKKNNDYKNLVPLCKTCHGKTNYNREVWKKFFQKT